MAAGVHKGDRVMKSRQRGYSLPELLIVVAIVGMISLIGVPAFISYFNSMRVNSALRAFTADVRGARQRAVTTNRPVKFSFETGAGERSYWIADGNTAGTTWTLVGGERELPEWVYLNDTTFVDEDDPADGQADIIFQPNGTITRADGSAMPTETVDGQQVTLVEIRTDTDVPFNQYIVYFQQSGRLSTTRAKV